MKQNTKGNYRKMIDSIIKFFREPVVYTCLPVLLFSVGFLWRQYLTKLKHRQNILFDLIHSKNALLNGLTYKHLEVLRNSINNIYRTFPTNTTISNAIHVLFATLNNNPTNETIDYSLTNLIIQLSKYSWHFSLANKFKQLKDIAVVPSYNPKLIIEYEKQNDEYYKNMDIILQSLATNNVMTNMGIEERNRFLEAINNKELFDEIKKHIKQKS